MRKSRFTTAILSAAVIVAPLVTGALASVAGASRPTSVGDRPVGEPLTAAQAKALSTNVTDRVVVVFKDQFSMLPDTASNAPQRAAAVAAAQRSVLDELSATHAAKVRSIRLVNAVSATVSPGEAQRLAANPAVAGVVKDEPTRMIGTAPGPAERAQAGSGSLPGTCAGNGKVELDPQAVETIHAATQSGTGASAQALGYTGAGVKVAFIADGLDVNNPDFVRPDGTKVFVDYQDFSGDGTAAATDEGGEAFLDASAVAAQGRETYDVSGYGYGDGSNRPCNIRILGVAPGASLVGLDVFGSHGAVFGSVVLEAIDYAVNVDHVNVLNESLGANPFPDQGSLDLVKMANDAAVAAGVTVTVSTGDTGVGDTLGTPATDPEVISAGASTTYRAYAQTGIAGIDLPGVTGWLNNNISALSASGFTQDGSTVDVVAPGDLNWALCTPKPKRFPACIDYSGRPSSVELAGGTSQAAPLTAGVAALVIEAYARAHGGAMPSPALVKQIIVSTADDISAPAEQQGAGLIDAYTAVQAAAAAPGTAKRRGHAVLKRATQFNAVGAAGSAQSFTETLTNTGADSQRVALSSRTLGTYEQVAATTVMLADATNDVATTTFTVPRGQARLDASLAYVGHGNAYNYAASLGLSLISPSGKFAEYNLGEDNGNYDDAQVADPEPGTWTAVIFGYPSSEGGTTGPVLFGARTAAWAPFGTLSTSSLTLAAGQSGTFTLTVATPAKPGDESGSVIVTSDTDQPAFASTTTVPVTLRSLAPTPTPSTTFTGTLTGGNGRQANTGQTAYYQVQIPAGLPELNAQVTTPDAHNTFFAELIDPVTGEAASTASNSMSGWNSSGGTVTPQLGTQLHVLHPHAGLWTLAVDFYNQVSGTALSQPFTVTLDRTPVAASADLPDSPNQVLPVGQPTTVFVNVTNSGDSPEAYFIDARLDQSTELNLTSLTDAQTRVPIPNAAIPQYLVPTHTTSITASATAPVPIFFDYAWQFGDPDIISSGAPASTASGTFTSDPVVAGPWSITPYQAGPDGKAGVSTVTATTAMTVMTAAFDTTVTSPAGDLWLESLHPRALIHPYIADAGQTISIPVTITPHGRQGRMQNGIIYVDDVTSIKGMFTNTGSPGIVNQASDVVALPYEYAVG